MSCFPVSAIVSRLSVHLWQYRCTVDMLWYQEHLSYESNEAVRSIRNPLSTIFILSIQIRINHNLLLRAALCCSDFTTTFRNTLSYITGAFDCPYMTLWKLTLLLNSGTIAAIPTIALRLLNEVKFCT
jgi:hypothetical protein